MHRREDVLCNVLRAVIVISLALVASWAHAEPGSVAIVNLATDQHAGAAACSKLRRNLQASQELAPLPPGELSRSLERPLAPWLDDSARLGRAREELERASQALIRLDYERSLRALDEAEDVLLTLQPAPEVWRMLADIAFWRGDILLREGKPEQARLELAAVRRLQPDRPEPEPARHRPEVIEAFRQAAPAAGAAEAEVLAEAELPATAAVLEVTAPFDGVAIHLDGIAIGTTPAAIRVPAGVHYVIGTHPNNFVIGERVVVEPRTRTPVRLRFEVITVDEQARYVRRWLLARAPVSKLAPGVLTDAARRVAELTSTAEVLLVAEGDEGRMSIAWYEARTRTLGPWQWPQEAAEGLLVRPGGEPAGAPRPPQHSVLAPALPAAPGRDAPRAWHEQTWPKVVLASVVTAAVIGVAVTSFGSFSAVPETVEGSTCCTVRSR